jgi:hypothetical protein
MQRHRKCVMLNGCACQTKCCIDTILGNCTTYALPSVPAFCTQLCTLKDTDLTLFLKTSREPVAKLSRIIWLVASFGGSPSLRESHGVGKGLSTRHLVGHVYFLCSHTACYAWSDISKFCFCLQRLCRMTLKINRDSNSAIRTHSVCVSRGSYNKQRLFTDEAIHSFIKNQSIIRLNPSLQTQNSNLFLLLPTRTVYFPSSYVRLSPTLHIYSYLHFARRREGKR